MGHVARRTAPMPLRDSGSCEQIAISIDGRVTPWRWENVDGNVRSIPFASANVRDHHRGADGVGDLGVRRLDVLPLISREGKYDAQSPAWPYPLPV